MGAMDSVSLLARASGNNQNSNTQTGSSLSAFVSTLIPVLIVAVIVFTCFLIFRKKYDRVYSPRATLPAMRNWQRSPKQSGGLLGWRKEYSELKDEHALGHSSLDNYLFLRFFKMLIIMSFVGCLITWPILFPVNATGKAPNIDGFDILSFSHVEPGPRYFAQALVAWVFLAFVMFLINREARHYVRLRQQYLLSPYERSRISANTILCLSVPEGLRNEEHLRNQFPHVRHVWMVSVPEALAENVTERDKAAAKLDSGENGIVKNHFKRQLKLEKKGQASAGSKMDEAGVPVVDIEKKDRPTHRLPVLKFLPLGKKVDTIDWSRGELKRLVPSVAQEQIQRRNDKSDVQGACFIEFDTVHAAHEAMQSIARDKKSKMTAADTGVPPQDIKWNNLIKPSWKINLFKYAGSAFIWWLCIFWTIPVAVIGCISNINYLTNKVPFLSFINDIPPVILGVVTGLLPVILLAVLMALVPIICGVIAGLFEPTTPLVQLRIQKMYFPFQVIQVFLITTFSSAASSVTTQIIKNPSKAPSLLATNLPKASNFYICYFVLFGLNAAAMQFLNVVPLLFVLFIGKILDKTPRKMYNRYVNLGGLGWGALYPVYTNLGVIALSYSCIAPLVLGFATVGFTLLYLGFRYNVLFTLGTTVPTQGRTFARALQQLTVGIYLSEICLIGLFAIGVAKARIAIGPLVLMIILLIGTIVWQVMMRRSLRKLSASLPEPVISEQDDGYGARDVEKEARESSLPSDHSALPKSERPNTPAAQGGFMGRLKGLFTSKSAHDTIWRVSPHLNSPVRRYTQREHDDAYIHPAIISECPAVWVARDKYGVSHQEVSASRREIGEGIEISDDQAWYDEKGNIQFNRDEPEKAPIYKDEPEY